MRILEVIGKQQKSREDLGDYQSRLRDLRMKRVGSGAFASVYQHPQAKDVVVKVSIETKEPLMYLNYIVKHQDNPYVPKVYDVRRYSTGELNWEDDYFIVHMEKLREYYKLNGKQKQDVLLKHFGREGLEFAVNHLGTPFNNFFYYLVEDFDRDVVSTLRKIGRKTGLPSKHLVDVLLYISNFGSEPLDFSDKNIMLRGDTPVFTDPLA